MGYIILHMEAAHAICKRLDRGVNVFILILGIGVVEVEHVTSF
jgi:phosphatidylserine/phosphatidylglycerophosphate/cardiolipin synthase-like enzyme